MIPQANVPGLRANSRYLPGEPKERNNLNRNFPSDSGVNQARGEIASAIWNLAQKRHRLGARSA